MQTYTFQLFAAKKGGGNTWINFRVTALYYNTIFIGVQDIEVVDTSIFNVAMVDDWLDLLSKAQDRANEYFNNLHKAVA